MAPGPKLHLENFLPYRLSVLSNTVSGAIAAAYFAHFGLTIPEWRVMAVLAANPGLSAAEVTARTAMDKVAVSRAVAALLAAGRLRRTTAKADRRRTHLRECTHGSSSARWKAEEIGLRRHFSGFSPGAPVPEDPMKSFRPSGSEMSRPLARLDLSLAR